MLLQLTYPDLLHRLHGLLLDQFDVESRGQDEDEHGGSGGADEAENVPDGGDEDDQGVGAGQQDHGDDGVADPAEVLGRAQELVDGGTDLRGERRKERLVYTSC